MDRVEHVIESAEEIEFPDVCSSCGIETSDEIYLDVTKSVGITFLFSLVMPFGTLFDALCSLNKSHVKVNCCRRCRKTGYYNLGTVLMFILGVPLFLCPLIFNEQIPESVGMVMAMVGVFLSFTCLVPYGLGKQRSTGLVVEHDSGRFLYKFSNEEAYHKVIEELEGASSTSAE